MNSNQCLSIPTLEICGNILKMNPPQLAVITAIHKTRYRIEGLAEKIVGIIIAVPKERKHKIKTRTNTNLPGEHKRRLGSKALCV